METDPEQDAPNAGELSVRRGDIRFCDVSFDYEPGQAILNDVNLHIESGKKIALVGPSGGGKTTLCHLIPRFYELKSGRIMIDDIDITSVTRASLRQNVGLVSQDVFLFTGTIAENIAYPIPDADEGKIIEAAKLAKIHDFIMSLPDGYQTYVGERGVKLSGGQKQRIAIARIFLKNPPILILDEATSALDNQTELDVQSSLDELCTGRTTLVVAHRLSTVKNADVILVMTKNGIEEQG